MARLLNRHEVATLLHVSVKTLTRSWKAGGFPPPIRIGGQLRWRGQELESWMDDETERTHDAITIRRNAR